MLDDEGHQVASGTPGELAIGGAGLVYVEMTCPSPEARISPGDTGLWNETQRDAFQRIVDFCHANSKAKMCMQLGHSGRKGSTQLGWEDADHPRELTPRECSDVSSVHPDPAHRERVEPRQAAQQSGLAAGVGADDGRHAAGWELEVETLDDRVPPVAEGDALGGDRGAHVVAFRSLRASSHSR